MPSHDYREYLPCSPYSILKYTNIVLRRYRCWSLQDQEHSERRQEAQALGGPVGQTEYVTCQLQWRSREENYRRFFENAARELRDTEGKGKHKTDICSQ